MTTRCSSRVLALVAGAMLSLVALFAINTSTATAACPNYTVINNQPCALTFYFVCPGSGAMGPYTVPGNTSIIVGLPATCPNPQFVPIICGNRRPMPVGGCLFNVWTGGPGLCCSDICQDLANCIIKINPAAGPCTC